ncbi:MAG TPA: nuclear transport factor 2 family protein [Solirubrobacterales bacterium]|nr:nuclear transport factor 2 family protein [Solirubrobacterales bacterium]
MSQTDVQLVRAYFEDLDRALASYSRSPDVPFADTPDGKRLRERLHPEVVWRPPFPTEEEFRGYDGITRALAVWSEAVEDWRITVVDLVDAGGGWALGTLRIHTRGRESGAAVDQTLFTVFEVRDGQIVLIEDHLDRPEALEAAGL